MSSRPPQDPQPDVWSVKQIATVFREVGSVLDGVVARLKHPELQPVSFHPALTQLREIEGLLKPIRDRLWLRQYEAQLLREQGKGDRRLGGGRGPIS